MAQIIKVTSFVEVFTLVENFLFTQKLIQIVARIHSDLPFRRFGGILRVYFENKIA
ncbi:MAG: hypothetical protein V4585_05800 [Bacteroidota bacterium]